MTNRRKMSSAAACVVLLSACGGGGSDAPKGDLYITYEYPAETRLKLFDTIDVRPTLSGFEGRKHSFKLASLLSSELPSVSTFSTTDGSIRGYAAKAGTSAVVGEVSVEGFINTLIASTSIQITTDISVTFSKAPVRFISTAPYGPITPIVSGLLPNDSISNFRLRLNKLTGQPQSVLPSGFSLNAQTGEFGGLPTGRGTYHMMFEATVIRGGKEATIGFDHFFNIAI